MENSIKALELQAAYNAYCGDDVTYDDCYKHITRGLEPVTIFGLTLNPTYDDVTGYDFQIGSYFLNVGDLTYYLERGKKRLIVKNWVTDEYQIWELTAWDI
jgi:hypothetical protein